ncbi:hypothetical protein PR202_ga07937 [Eleusine coracana subsp. coracana]|uniref:USP domain-containing protein n=1 Tax=Eleusine coracana subsp. coracana TaxID=191504 RepID=A0AAV5C0V6_ELECO|nr:hypothetical protein PR202_ga07937 [Eleusine coracana subsp. coracana]
MPPPMAADAVAEAVLVPTPLAVLPMAADEAEDGLAPTPLAVLAADAIETVLAPMALAPPPPAVVDDGAELVAAPTLPIADGAEAVLVPIPVADPPPVTADDADADSAAAPVTPASPPKQAVETNPSVTPAEDEEVPSQGDIEKVTDMKENETGHCSLVTDMKENETGHCSMVTDMKENDDGESNHALGCERNDESQDVSRAKSVEKLNSLEMRNMRLCRRGFVDPRLVMGDRYMEDVYNMGLGFDNIRDIGHCNQSDHIHDGDACHLDYQYDHNDAQFPSFRRRAISSDFEKGVQQDAQEFLRCLLDKLDEASIAPSSSEEPPTIEGGIAKEIFGGRLKSQCDHWSDRSEPFLDLSLEINMVETLVDALESFTKVELIEGVMCDGCKSCVNMEKHLKIEQAPEVLVVHLKRFLNSGHDITKISDKVKYTLELDIDPFMCSVDNAPQKYDLYGVVDHWGAYGRGHYVCYIRSSQSDWFQFDDAKVSVCSEETVLDITSYLLFYVKQGSSPWFSSLLEKESKVRVDGLAELGLGEIVKDKDETTSSGGQEGSDRFGEPAEDGNGPSLDGNTLSGALKQLEGCNLGGISGGSQELSCITVSGGENGHIDRLSEPLETKEDCSPPGSLLDNKEMKESTQGDSAGNQGSSPGVGEEGRVAGKKRKQSKSRSADDEFCKESRRQTRRK